ncbi:hypothetical protein [Mycoplasma phocoenae]|uniref:DNA polymerase III subunit delta n=1 Tax=Mycoplasma phocoenae TaxID=754517 RepID=A0A858U7H1_9MOLU|nr:hypothetical protein [Mycoplasma phocoenae]QJG67205.1 hypothetical protein HGG69_02730 [Mycoplasma phocoenae]
MNYKNIKIYTLIDNAIKSKKYLQSVLFIAHPNVEIDSYILYFVNKTQSSNFNSIDELKFQSNVMIIGNETTIHKNDIIEAINESFSSMNPDERKFIIIKNIENSSAQSLNALLKFTENLNKNVFLVLSTNKRHSILNTIKSRSTVIEIMQKNNENLPKEKLTKKTEFLDFYSLITDDMNVFKTLYSAKIEAFFVELMHYLNKCEFVSIINLISKDLKADNFKVIMLFLNVLSTELIKEQNDVISKMFEFNKNVFQQKINYMLMNEIVNKYSINFDNKSLNFSIQKAAFVMELKEVLNG